MIQTQTEIIINYLSNTVSMIGISSYAFHDLPLSEALENIEKLSKGAEIFSEGFHDLLKDSETPYSYNLEYTVHAPNTDLNIGSIREPMRKAGMELIQEMVDICSQIDARVLVVHPGYFTYSCDIPDARVSLKKSLLELEKITDGTDIKICVENMPSDWNCFLFQYPDLDLGNNGFALDVGHANTTQTLDDFLEYNISHFHIHDNTGKSDEHLWVGAGNIDFKGMKDVLKKNSGMKVLEHRSRDYVEKSLKAIKDLDIK